MLISILLAGILQATPIMFPYVPTHEAPENITNVSTWPSWEKGMAGDQGFIKSVGDSFVDGNGVQRRFLGTNICFTGCFPTHEDADKVAAELARYGINLVRLHYVHHKFPPGKIYPKQDSVLEPEQLERFDYLFAKLKERGIYIYFQLNISRKFTEHNGIVNISQLPYFYNGIDNIDYRFIQLQQKFIHEIMTHVNPYTGLSYKDEPAISMLELANENSIVNAWFTPRYNFSSLVEPYMTEFKTQWNNWLISKYGNTKELKKAWLSGFDGDGKEFITDGALSEEYFKDKWFLQLDDKAKASLTLEPATSKDKLDGTHFLRLKVEQRGSSPNMPQFGRGLFSIKSMQPMTLKFKMRADNNTQVNLRFSQAHAPWQIAGLSVYKIQLTRKWQEFTFRFVSNMDDDEVRIVLGGVDPGTIDFADFSLVSGGGFDWPREWSLENESIPIPSMQQWTSPPQRALDFTAFLSQLENVYFGQMYSYAKVNVQVPQPVTGTQITYGLSLPHSQMDYVDCHSYYNHPIFSTTNKHYNNWSMGSGSMVNDIGSPENKMSSIARGRVLGRPYTISEYDHPNLSYYAAEGNVMGAAVGAFQNWSGIVQFAWSHSDNFFRDDLDSRFDMCSAPQKLAHLPACYAMFVRGDVKTGPIDTMMVRLSKAQEDIRAIAISQFPGAPNRISTGLMTAIPVMLRSGTVITENEGQFPMDGKVLIQNTSDIPQNLKDAFDAKEMTNSTGEITWNWEVPGAGFFKVDTEGTKAFTGFVRGRTFSFEGMELVPGTTEKDWLTLSLTCKIPRKSTIPGVLCKGSWLLAVTGQVRNTDEKIVEINKGTRISASEFDGGSVGVAPILCEGVPARIVLKGLAGKVQFFALDVDGFRKTMIPVTSDGADAILEIGPDYQTFWYEIVVR